MNDIEQTFNNYFDYDGMLTIQNNLVSIRGNCELKRNVERLPVKFSSVTGNFIIDNKKLLSLEGSPIYVGGNFWCCNNKLTSLKGAPIHVGGHFWCRNNKFTSLAGAPSTVGGCFDSDSNKLLSLTGIPKIINGPFYINVYPHTPLLKILTVTGITEFYFYNNLTSSMSTILYVLSDLFKEHYGKKNATMNVGLEMIRLGYGSNAKL